MVDWKKVYYFFRVHYTRFFARIRLRRLHPRIIGIGGASGKTSTSTLIAGILSDHFSVLYKEGMNTAISLPVTILGLRITSNDWDNWSEIFRKAPFVAFFGKKDSEVFVSEMGIDEPTPPNNMQYLLDLFVPDIALLTNIEFEHSANFNGNSDEEVFESIAKEELALLHATAHNGGTVILNGDDPRIMKEKSLLGSNVFVFSTKHAHADLFVQEVKITKKTFRVALMYKEKKYVVSLPFGLPIHYASTIVSALSVAVVMGVPLLDAITSLQKHFFLPPGRATLFSGIKNTTLIDSSYNSSLTPLLDLIDFLDTIHGTSRRVAILGDMRELGEQTQQIHEKAAQKILQTVDIAFLIGPAMKSYVYPVLQKEKKTVFVCDTFTQARSCILQNIKKGDTILVKGSQNTLFLERAVELLLANPLDSAKLCRRGPMWDKKRAGTK